MKRLLFAALVFFTSCQWTCPVFGLEKGMPLYYSTSDYTLGVQSTYEFSDGQKRNIPAAEPLLMINGTFTAEGKIFIKNDRAMVPLRLIAEETGAMLEWFPDTGKILITGESSVIEMTIGQKEVYVNGSRILTEAPPEILQNGVTYVPLRLIAESLGGSAGYLMPTGYLDIADNPVVWYDAGSESHGIAMDTLSALELAKLTLRAGLDNFVAAYAQDPLLPQVQNVENTIRGKIDIMEFSYEFSRYYVFDGPYTVLVDKYTTDIYFRLSPYIVSSIVKVDINDKSLYVPSYIQK